MFFCSPRKEGHNSANHAWRIRLDPFSDPSEIVEDLYQTLKSRIADPSGSGTGSAFKWYWRLLFGENATALIIILIKAVAAHPGGGVF